MNYNLRVKMLPGELWRGLYNTTTEQPFGEFTVYSEDFRHNHTTNQFNPLLVSNRGRYIWCEKGFKLSIAGGELSCGCDKAPIELVGAGKTMKDAFLAAVKAHFPPDGHPPMLFFDRPQYNTWIELNYDQNEDDLISYAQSILDAGMPAGILMVDDGWSEYYGDWSFSPAKFPHPKETIAKVHEMGFKIMFWVCPFVSPDSPNFRYLNRHDMLVKNSKGQPAIREWWNGYSAVIDLSNPEAEEWFYRELKRLVDEYGVDGFKLDAGDGEFYEDDDITFGNVDANEQTELYTKFGLRYECNEYRACFKCAGKALVQRQRDKSHSWSNANGIGQLIPSGLLQGILGYAYTCPDMIGGGDIGMAKKKQFDPELTVRYTQCSALFPMMQFSAAIWRLLPKQYWNDCFAAVQLHLKYASYIQSLVEHADKTGEPIMRYMDYEFPNEGMETVEDQFMLGDRLLVAPVIQKGEVKREISFPKGKWIGDDGSVVEGPCRIAVDAPLSRLPYYELKK